MHTRRLLAGLATWIPGTERLRIGRTGGSESARYCYSVWLRHVVYARQNGLPTDFRRVGELGPGDSLGVGLCALLTGTQSYAAFDVVEFADVPSSRRILYELVGLLHARAPIPDEREFPDTGPRLESYAFPHEIYPGGALDAALAPERIAAIDAALGALGGPPASPADAGDGPQIRYSPAWRTADGESDQFDLILSQATLEHVDDLPATYAAIRRLLAGNGVTSHEIDFTSHGTATVWNGHWTFSAREWRLIRGRRPWLLNREPWSAHRRLIGEAGLRIVAQQGTHAESGVRRSDLQPQFAGLDDVDLTTPSLVFQAVAAA